MKRLITILMLVALIGGISVAAFATAKTVVVGWDIDAWLILWVPDTVVDLGTIGPGSFVPGVGWIPLESGPLEIAVFANIPFSATVSAAFTGPTTVVPVLERFEIRGFLSGVGWLPWTSLETAHTVPFIPLGHFHVTDLQYRFRPMWGDPPGDYAVTVTWTVTAE